MDIQSLLTPNTGMEALTANKPSNERLHLRSGPWSDSEERYAAALVKYFIAGALTIRTGTSLRGFLAKKLRCSEMRVSTKLFLGSLDTMVIPKHVGRKRFFPMEELSHAQRQRAADELRQLEAAYFRDANLAPLDPQSEAFENPTTSSVRKGNAAARMGSWSYEEQVYASALIDGFLNGVVKAENGVSLRSFLADRLRCSPMRISKKLSTGVLAQKAIPKRLGTATYQRNLYSTTNDVLANEARLEQLRLECFSSSLPPHERIVLSSQGATPYAYVTSSSSSSSSCAHPDSSWSLCTSQYA